MPADRLAFAVRVGRDEDLGRPSSLPSFSSLEDLLAAGDDLVRRLEAFVDVDPQLALGQIADVSHRGDDLVVLARDIC